MQSIMFDEDRLNKLAFNYDPSPILTELSQGGMKVDPQGNWPGMPMGTLQQANPYTNMVEPKVNTPAAAPMQPPMGMAMSALAGAQPQQQMPQAPAVQPKQAVPMKISIPDISQLVSFNVGPQTKKQPSLAQLMGAK